MGRRLKAFFSAAALAVPLLFCAPPAAFTAPGALRPPALSARSAIVVDADSGSILYGKNPHLRLPPASTTKVMTVIVALEKMPVYARVRVSARAAGAERSRAGLTPGVEYPAWDLVKAALVSSSNDAAVALAEAAAGSEREFAVLMNAKARQIGMKDTRFVNSTGLPDKTQKQYSTSYDLALLIRYAVRDRRLDAIMGIMHDRIYGSDGRSIPIKSHNKMLWRMPRFVKGKTGWTFASRHTFVGTDYAKKKRIHFAMLSSTEPWTDIERLASFGFRLERSENG